MATKLFFIHKDAASQSLSHSGEGERREVHRHVQLARLHRERTHVKGAPTGQQPLLLHARSGRGVLNFRPAPATRRAAKRASGQSGGSSTPSTTITTPATTISAYVWSSPGRIANASKLFGHQLLTLPDDDDDDVDAQRRPSEHLSSPPIQENSTDPFHVSAVPVNAPTHTLLQYFIHVSHPRTWHSETRTQRHTCYTFQQSAFEIVESCVADAMSMFTMLASMANQLQYFEGRLPPQDPTVLVQRALAATREYVDTGTVDRKLIFSIHSLANAEFYRFNVKAARVHVCAVKALVDQLGGLGSFPQYLREWFVAGDEFIAAEAHEKPLFAASEIDPGPWHDETFVARANMPHLSGPFSGVMHDMPEPLRDLLESLWECARKASSRIQGQSQHAAQFTPAFGHWLHLRMCAIRNRLLSLSFACPYSDAFRLALLACCYMTMTVTGRKRTMLVIASRMRSILSATDPNTWSRDYHLWIVTIGALASEGDAGVRKSFVARLVAAVDGNTGSSLSQLEEEAVISILGRLLYYEPVHRKMAEALVMELKDHESGA